MMNRQQSDISGHPYFTQHIMKRNSFYSLVKKEKKGINHIWNIYDDHPNTAPPFCIYCQVEFNSLIHWHAHMTSFIHRGPMSKPPVEANNNSEAERLIVCKFCQQDIRVEVVKEHRCCLTEATRLVELIGNYNNTYCPLICVLCKTVKVFSSQAVLQVHIVTKHSPMKDPQSCSLCNTKFKNNDINVHEAHAVDIHGPELNLLYFKLSETNNPVKKSKSESVKYSCALSYYSNNYNKDKIACNDVITDIFQLTLHTLCFHGFEPHLGILDRVPKDEEKVSESFMLNKDMCRYCGFQVSGLLQLNQHIMTNHALELVLRRDYMMKKKLFIAKIPLHLTCFHCITIFPSTAELQVHIMVRHSNMDFGYCGLCDKKFLTSSDNEHSPLSFKMQWRTIQYHETCHLKQFKKYKYSGLFSPRLFPSAVLYKSHKEFEEDLENRKNLKSDILFTDEQIAYFKLLGHRNYEDQINMEMLAN